jgi:hypothetical protein
MNLFVCQPFGLGDIIFTRTLIKALGGKEKTCGYLPDKTVYWPVKEHYYNDLVRAYPDIYWIKGEGMANLAPTTKEEILKSRIVPIRWSDTFQKVPYEAVMAAKYAMYNMDWRDWKNEAMWQRDPSMEDSLFEIHGIKPQDEYALISGTFGSDFQHSIALRLPETSIRKQVFIKQIPGYSLFDWAKLIEFATEIHFVASSNIYLLEMLELSAKSINIYDRGNGHHRQYEYLLRRHKYNLK